MTVGSFRGNGGDAFRRYGVFKIGIGTTRCEIEAIVPWKLCVFVLTVSFVLMASSVQKSTPVADTHRLFIVSSFFPRVRVSN
jgi:hypothetical protein